MLIVFYFSNHSGLIVSCCIEKLVSENLIPNACNVKGNFYQSPKKTMSVLTYMVQSYEIYRFLSIKKEVIDLEYFGRIFKQDLTSVCRL